MVKITRVHGFRERLHQLDRNSTLEQNHSVRADCMMHGGECDCPFIDKCRYVEDLRREK